ncbi:MULTISPECIES: amidohydrolase family protein [unclassified Haladaptatus]|uniref:amidohydrolase family protein n=1 Tax=unclassified Haladaptatus TaxID=2622732 RepID=UPI00209BBDDF|nr:MULTISPECIES: amidohydrolase family protein [unclassified Haladaptatus]MCO8243647.1 amidohydrolase [Haladaptatus sp. AB643]MCO8255056.1 amidohydrolase [Haladaptatus sp. AB618]
MPEIIDAYTHVLTESFFDELTDRYGFQGLSGRPEFLWDIEQRKADMDDYGIDKQVITLALPTLFQGMEHDLALEITRLANDEIRRLADEHPDSFVPVGTIPTASEEFLAEFDRCIDDLDMAGVQIFSNVDGRPLDDDEFWPLFERAEATKTPLWMHPQLWEWYDWASEYMEHRLFGWPFDTTLALSRLVFGGVMEAYPDLELVSHHGGGMVPYFGERIAMFYEQRQAYPENYPGFHEHAADLSKPAEEYFEQFYADTAVSGSVSALECADDFFGSSNLLFGTDYPFSPERGRRTVEVTRDAVESMDVESDVKTDIFAGNLRTLLD